MPGQGLVTRPGTLNGFRGRRWKGCGISGWFYKEENTEIGPVSRVRLEELAALGLISGDAPVRFAGSAVWMPYDATMAQRSTLNLDGPAVKRACSRCGGSFAPEALMPFAEEVYCGRCKQDFLQHLAQGTRALRDGARHVFLKRAMAKAVDLNLTVLLFFALALTFDLLAGPAADSWIYSAVPGATVVFHVAFGTLTTSRFGGTPGKLLFRLRVSDSEGRRTGYARALIRTVAEFLSMACLGLGYLITDSSTERRTLHDRIAGTRVVASKGPWPWA